MSESPALLTAVLKMDGFIENGRKVNDESLFLSKSVSFLNENYTMSR